MSGRRICTHRTTDGNHRPRRLLHPDEHGVAADLARRHPQPQVSELARASSTSDDGSGALHAGRPARARGVAPARATPPTTSSPATRTTSIAFIGPAHARRRVSTHNPLGVTFAAGVYTSIFGESKQPINSHYARKLFDAREDEPVPAAVQGDRRRIGRLADHADAMPGTSSASTASSKAAASRPTRWRCSTARSHGEPLPRQVDVAPSEGCATPSWFPTSARRSASSR